MQFLKKKLLVFLSLPKLKITTYLLYFAFSDVDKNVNACNI